MMTKPVLHLGFTDYYPGLDTFFLDTLSKSFDIKRDDENAKYIIFCDETFGTNNLKYDPNKTIKIFFTGENRRPWNYQAHYAITFDHLDSDRFYRLPLYVLDNYNGVSFGCDDLFNLKRTFTSEDWYKRTEFCGFVSSNGACAERNNMFVQLSQYKKVDSAGPWMNTVGYVIPRGFEAQKYKMEFLSKYRFNLCYENSSYPGYATEKPAHAFIAGTVPIYWGSPVVEVDFNIEAMISRHQYQSDKEMIDHIIHIDNDMNAWLDIMNRPALAKNNKFYDLNRFRNWFMTNVYKG